MKSRATFPLLVAGVIAIGVVAFSLAAVIGLIGRVDRLDGRADRLEQRVVCLEHPGIRAASSITAEKIHGIWVQSKPSVTRCK